MVSASHTRTRCRSVAGLLILSLFWLPLPLRAQDTSDRPEWIRPSNANSPAVGGIRGGIVFGLWPHDVETGWPSERVRPRGLIRVGLEQNGLVHLINFVESK